MLLRIGHLLLPFILWCFVVRDFLSGSIPLNMDTNTIYGVVKYYFNNLLNGVVPLWDPFVTLGRPFYALPICNLFNPVTQIVPLLKLLGVNYHTAFIVYISAYFFVGCLGFYVLAREIFKDRAMAYVAYVCFMFSSLGISMFTQLTFIEIVVPTVWFFYFLYAFGARPCAGNFLGLVLTVMVTLSAYLPFYFVTVAGVVMGLHAVIFPAAGVQFIRKAGVFMRARPFLCLVGALGILLSAGPLLAYKALDASGETVSPGRHCQYTSLQECYDRTMNQKGGMLYEEIARSGGLGERLDVGYLFAHLDKISYGSDSFFFVPLWVYVVLFTGMFLRLDRRAVLLVAAMVVIGLVALGEGAGLHRFLYDHVFFFRYFRNLFFFGAFLVPMAIVLGVLQLQALLAIKPKGVSRKKLVITGTALMHLAFFFVLRRYPGVMPAAWVTLGLSAAFFACYYMNSFRRNVQVWTWLFSGLALVHPVAVMSAYAGNAVEFRCPLPSAHVTPVFAWSRPDQAATSACRIYQFVPYEDFWYAMSMTDAPAKIGFPQAAARWTFDLGRHSSEKEVAAYAKYKFYLYDGLNVAGAPVAAPSASMAVRHFDVNRVVFGVNFPARKFLVYNDSYMSFWQVRIDGHREILLRANTAFKGVWVPPGEHEVEFLYAPPGGQWIYLLTAGLLLVVLAATAAALLRGRACSKKF